MDKLRYPVLTALLLSVFTGFLSISEFGLSRTFAYMPIFLIGFYYNSYVDNFCKKHQKIYSFLSKKHMLTLLSILILGVLIALAYVLPFKIIFLKHAISFSLYDLIMRTVVICAGILFTLIIHKLMTNSSGFITKIGRNSMSVYIFHLFLVVPFRSFFSSFYLTNPVMCVILILISTLVVAYVFSRDIVSRGLNACMDGIYKMIMFS